MGRRHVCSIIYSMYGTHRAATNWQAHYTKVLVQNGFTVGLANGVTFHNKEKSIYCMVHGDDFVTTGPKASLDWFKNVLTKAFEIKTERIGHAKEDKKELNNRKKGQLGENVIMLLQKYKQELEV